LEVFPKPNKSFKIESFQFPKLDNEFDLRIEILIGFDSMTDCNHYILNGKIEEWELPGYKNSYFVVYSDFSIIRKKNKACFIDPIDTFIAMKSIFLPYNSILPFVFIIPERMYIKHRIFKTSDFVPLNNLKFD
jgi:serine protease inhibitor ecotin